MGLDFVHDFEDRYNNVHSFLRKAQNGMKLGAALCFRVKIW